MRLLGPYPSATLLVLFGIGGLIAYVVARGRRMGSRDLIFFGVMALVTDWLVFAIYGMLQPNGPGNLIVLIGLVFAVPIAAFSTLGVVVVALRVAHIAATGGKDA